MSIKEAGDGDRLTPNSVLLAPGGKHLEVCRFGNSAKVVIRNGPMVSGHKPSVDVMMSSVAQAFGEDCLGVIMTGMGRDGADGCGAIRAAGGYVLGQDETGLDVYDMNKVLWAVAYRVRPSRDIITYPGWVSYLDPVVHPKDRIAAAVNKGERMLIDATKPFDNPKSEEWFGLKFAPLAYPDQETMDRVRQNWPSYGIKC